MLRYAITPGRLPCRYDESAAMALALRCAQLAREGVDFVLIREKRLAGGELTTLVRSIVREVRAIGSGTRLLVAQRADVAAAAAADGVHLSSAPGELTPDQVRAVMPGAFVSQSCHTLAEVRRTRASAVLFGPVLGKTADGVEVVRGLGLSALRQACVAAGVLPVFALGGVTAADCAACLDAGAAGVAAIRMFFPTE